jgi:hypothetical protein
MEQELSAIVASTPSGEVIPLEGRATRLAPPNRILTERLFVHAMTNEIPWPFVGSMTPTDFEESLWRGVLVQYAIESTRTGEQVGLLRADQANLFHRFAYISVFLLPEFKMRGWPLESLVFFANFLFKRFDLEHLYAEVAEVHLEQYRSGSGKFFEIEACFNDRLVVNGVRQNMYVLAVERDRALQLCASMIGRTTRHSMARVVTTG